ncbi:MAG TPA: hypothetical protein VIF62_20775 [Labilithrix sp.]
MKRGRKRAMRIVPRIVFGTIVVGVVPAVAASCDSSGYHCTGPGCTEAMGVAAVAFQCFDGSTAPQCRQQMGVAAVAFQCFDGSTAPECQPPPDSGEDSGDAPDDVIGDVEMG